MRCRDRIIIVIRRTPSGLGTRSKKNLDHGLALCIGRTPDLSVRICVKRCLIHAKLRYFARSGGVLMRTFGWFSLGLLDSH